MEVDYYDLLGIPANADNAQIQSSYLTRLQRLYDASQSSGPLEKASALEQMDLLRRGFDTLSDPTKREAYDISRAASRLPAETKLKSFCSRCGASIRQTARFCPMCGLPVNQDQSHIPIKFPDKPLAAPIILRSQAVDDNEQEPLPRKTIDSESSTGPANLADNLLLGEQPIDVPNVSQGSVPPRLPADVQAPPGIINPTFPTLQCSGQLEYGSKVDLDKESLLKLRLLFSQNLQRGPDIADTEAAAFRNLVDAYSSVVRVLIFSPNLQIFPPARDLLAVEGKHISTRFSIKAIQLNPSGGDDQLGIELYQNGEIISQTSVPIHIQKPVSIGPIRISHSNGSWITIAAGITGLILGLIGIFDGNTDLIYIPISLLVSLLIISIGFLGLGIFLYSRGGKKIKVLF